MKRYFMAGLVVLLPAVLTILITLFLVNLLTKPFLGLIVYFIDKYDLSIMGSPELILIISKIVVLFVLVGFALLLGFLAQAFFVDYLFNFFDRVIKKIPLVNKIYKALQDVMSTLFSGESNSYSQVVLVPFPKEGNWSIGLVTQEDSADGSDQEHMGLMSVFVPGTPNPTMGFVLLFKREQVIFVDLTVDEALRFVVSFGSISKPFIAK